MFGEGEGEGEGGGDGMKKGSRRERVPAFYQRREAANRGVDYRGASNTRSRGESMRFVSRQLRCSLKA
jgi:hypothetical protein